jgi:DNA-binding beta-propeller fold protein YncE
MRRIPALLLSLALASTLSGCPPMASTTSGNAMTLALNASRDPAGAPGLQVRFRALALPTAWDRAQFRLNSPSKLDEPLEKSVSASDMAAAPDGSKTATRLFPLVPEGSDYQLQVRLYNGTTPVSGAQLDNIVIGTGATVVTATVTPLTNPVITGYTPTLALGKPGDTLHVLGSGFGDAAGSVTLHDKPVTVGTWSDGDITITLPADATTGMIVVTTAAGNASAGRPFAIRRDQLFLLGQTAGVQALTMGSFTALSGFPAQTGSAPGRMAYDAGRNRLYGLLEGSKQLAVLDAVSLDPLPGSPFGLDGSPGSVAYDAGSDRIFVTCVDTNKVTVFNAQTLQPVLGSPLAAGTGAVPNAIVANAGRVYWVNQGAGTVAGINAQTLQPLSGSPVSAGINPVAVAVDPGRNRLAVVSQVMQKLQLFDADTLTGIVTGDTGPAPMDLIFDARNDRYVCNTYNGNGIETYDPVTAVRLQSQVVDTGPVAMGLDPVHSRLLVAHALADKLTALDLPGLTLVGGGPIAVGRTPKAITYDSQQDRFWVANQASQQWALLGRAAVNLLSAGPVSVGITADMAAYDSTRHRIYIPQREGRQLDACDATTGQLLRNLRAPLGVTPGPIAYDARHDRIFVANRGPGTVSAFAAGDFSPVAGAPLTVGTNPVQLRYDLQSDRVYVLSMQSAQVHAFKAGDLSPVGPAIATGTQPIDLIVDPDGSRFFVLCKGSNTIEVYSASTLARTAAYTLAATPVALAHDPQRQRLFALVPGTGLVGLQAADGQVVTGSPWVTGTSATQLLFDPAKDQLYALDAANQRLEVRAGDTLAPVAGSPFATGLAATSLLIAQ